MVKKVRLLKGRDIQKLEGNTFSISILELLERLELLKRLERLELLNPVPYSSTSISASKTNFAGPQSHIFWNCFWLILSNRTSNSPPLVAIGIL